MCMCSFSGAAVLQGYDPAKAEIRKFTYVQGQGLRVTYQAQAPSEARRPGNRYWNEEDEAHADSIPTVMTSTVPLREAAG